MQTTDSDQDTDFIYTISETEGTDYDAFVITYDVTFTGGQIGRLSFKEKPDLDASYTYKVTIVSTDKYGKKVSKDFEFFILQMVMIPKPYPAILTWLSVVMGTIK